MAFEAEIDAVLEQGVLVADGAVIDTEKAIASLVMPMSRRSSALSAGLSVGEVSVEAGHAFSL